MLSETDLALKASQCFAGGSAHCSSSRTTHTSCRGGEKDGNVIGWCMQAPIKKPQGLTAPQRLLSTPSATPQQEALLLTVSSIHDCHEAVREARGDHKQTIQV